MKARPRDSVKSIRLKLKFLYPVEGIRLKVSRLKVVIHECISYVKHDEIVPSRKLVETYFRKTQDPQKLLLAFNLKNSHTREACILA